MKCQLLNIDVFIYSIYIIELEYYYTIIKSPKKTTDLILKFDIHTEKKRFYIITVN